MSALPTIIAHRGASACAPENTIAAFRAARDQNADGVELDVQLTLDRIVVVVHDRTLLRTTGSRRRVSSMTAREIRKLDCGSWFHGSFASQRVPTLVEVLIELRGKMIVNVEMKRNAGGNALVRSVVDAITSTRTQRQVILSSFDHRLLSLARRIAPEVERATLMHPMDVGLPSRAACRHGATAVVMSRRQLTAKRVADAVEHGLRTVVYTVDAPRDLERCFRYGVDAIITNAPAESRQALANHAEQVR